jgi:hypothetical protein
MTELPFIDRLEQQVAAPPEATWDGLRRVVPRVVSGGPADRFALFLRATRPAGGEPEFPAEGAVILGFRVGVSEPGSRLLLEGGHRFSTYSLDFRIEPAGEGSVLSGETRAVFPGLAGQIYKTFVIRARMHVLMTRRMLRAAARSAERGAA